MKVLKVKIHKNKGFEYIIILLCSLLPLVDSINGYFSGTKAIGSIYKILILGILFFHIFLKNKGMSRKITTILVVTITYILFSLAINTALFSGTILSTEYPIKLIFNILLFGFFYQCIKNGTLTGSTFYRILDNSAWLFAACFLIPYCLGLGNRVYANDIGYKAFFVSQNEMSLVIMVLCFFVVYKIYLKITILNSIQLGLLLLCGLLCNTKSTIIACLLIAFILLIIKAIKGSFKSKIAVFAVGLVGLFLMRNTIISSIDLMTNRYMALKYNHYNGSVLTSVLSARDIFVTVEWNNMMKEKSAFKILFGNGFCSGHLIEMDFFDMFFFLGIIGVLILFYFLILLFKRIRENTKSDNSKLRLFTYIIIFGFMFLTGHVIFMAMSGSYFIIYCCYLITYNAMQRPIKQNWRDEE